MDFRAYNHNPFPCSASLLLYRSLTPLKIPALESSDGEEKEGRRWNEGGSPTDKCVISCYRTDINRSAACCRLLVLLLAFNPIHTLDGEMPVAEIFASARYHSRSLIDIRPLAGLWFPFPSSARSATSLFPNGSRPPPMHRCFSSSCSLPPHGEFSPAPSAGFRLSRMMAGALSPFAAILVAIGL